MLPTRIFRNRWHALLFSGMICAVAAEFASDASAPVPASTRAAGAAVAARDTPAPAAPDNPAPQVDAGPSLFASLFASNNSANGQPTRMLPLDTDGDGIPDATAREVR